MLYIIRNKKKKHNFYQNEVGVIDLSTSDKISIFEKIPDIDDEVEVISSEEEEFTRLLLHHKSMAIDEVSNAEQKLKKCSDYLNFVAGTLTKIKRQDEQKS